MKFKPSDISNGPMVQEAAGSVSALHLGLLRPKHRLLVDGDNDGYPEQLSMTLGVAPGMHSGRIWAGLINLAVRLNIEACGNGISPPACCTRTCAGMLLVQAPSDKHRIAACLEKDPSGGWRLYGHSKRAVASILNSLALAALSPGDLPVDRIEMTTAGQDSCVVWRDGKELLCSIETPPRSQQKQSGQLAGVTVTDLISLGKSILTESDADPRGSRLNLQVVLPDQLHIDSGRAVLSLAGAAAARATEVYLPVANADIYGTETLCLHLEENRDPTAWLYIERGCLQAKGGPKALARLVNELKRLWFDADSPGGEKLAKWLERLHGAARLAAGKGPEGQTAYTLAKEKTLRPMPKHLWSKAATACRLLGKTEPEKIAAPPAIIRRASWRGEASRLLAEARQAPNGSGRIRCRGYLGGSLKTRIEFSHILNDLLRQKGYQPETIILRTYKPAVCWLLEEIESKLPNTANSLHISFRPFDRPNQMERPTRWIQEIYPAPDIFCQRRGWRLDQITLTMDSQQEQDYLLRAYSEADELVFETGLTLPLSTLPYLLARRDDQWAYPVASGLQLQQNNRLIWSCQLPTDRELLWRRFQEKWLPLLESAMIEALPALRKHHAPAFWEEIRLEVAIDEAQESLGLAEERIAPMEALHEDIYFGLLAFAHAFCKEYCPKTNLQLGRIMPLVRSDSNSRPSARLRMKPMQHAAPAQTTQATIKRFGYDRGYLTAELCHLPDSLSRDECEKLCITAAAWGCALYAHGDKLMFRARPAGRSAKPASTACLSVPDMETIPTGDEIRSWLWRLAGRPGMQVWQTGMSLMGRQIVAVESTACTQMPAQRARLLKPTLFINARHHANEVAGTNAAMRLLYDLACNEDSASVLTQANVVVVPLENADGVATLEEMLPDAPDHKLHAARYNSLGLEWYDQYFQDDTPIGEAAVKIKLFERWLPEYMVDLHGVPSHEWEQPFAGYLNPRFKEHWIPRSFVYAILPFFDQPEHPGGKEASTLARLMSAAMETEHDIVTLNRQIFDRYRRYAKAFEPHVFRSSLEGSLVVVPTCKRISKTNFGSQKWPLVRSEVISEVLDEVARGPWLARCARAHLVIIKTMLARISGQAKTELVRQAGPTGVRFAWRRTDHH